MRGEPIDQLSIDGIVLPNLDKANASGYTGVHANQELPFILDQHHMTELERFLKLPPSTANAAVQPEIGQCAIVQKVAEDTSIDQNGRLRQKKRIETLIAVTCRHEMYVAAATTQNSERFNYILAILIYVMGVWDVITASIAYDCACKVRAIVCPIRGVSSVVKHVPWHSLLRIFNAFCHILQRQL